MAVPQIAVAATLALYLLRTRRRTDEAVAQLVEASRTCTA
jgi:hypothetical protein